MQSNVGLNYFITGKKTKPLLTEKWEDDVIKNPNHLALLQDRFTQLTVILKTFILKFLNIKFFFIYHQRNSVPILILLIICISVTVPLKSWEEDFELCAL